MAKQPTKTGKALERQAADAYRAMGARKVEHDVELAGHQIDIYVEMETADRALHRIAVEAKDYTKPVGIEIVAEFAAVVDGLRRLKLVDEGVILSAAGFSKQARNAAREHNLRLLEPADLAAMAAETKLQPSPHSLVPAPSSGPIPPCPYRGLLAFREQDAPFFYGRETSTDLLVEIVLRHPPVVVVIGPSGSGKSSLVSAGLLPRLRQADAPDSVNRAGPLVAQCRPGNNPFGELADALLPLLEPEMSETDRLMEIPKAAKALQQGELELQPIVKRVLHKGPGANRFLLVIDQFEELYTLCTEPAIRRRFLDVLLATLAGQAAQRESDLTLILTLRADFLGQVLEYRPLADVLDKAQTVMLGPMNREELRAAIVCPAEKQGVAFESGLADRILDDVENEPGNLPLLEFALTLLWERQESGWLAHRAYEALGKVQGALTHYADQVFAGLSTADQERARRIFMQLVLPGEGTKDTRRRATRAELGEANWSLVQRLADTRLLVTSRDPVGQPIVEVVHEVLIQGWGRLRAWMNEDRDFRVWQEQLRAGLRRWDASRRDPRARLSGLSLDDAERWMAKRRADFGQSEIEFVQASREWQTREEQDWQQRLEKFREYQVEAAAAQQLAILGTAMAALQHRINNTFNLILPNVARLRRRLDMTDETTVEILDIIERNAHYASDLLQRIQEPLRETEVVGVDVNAVLSDVLYQTKEMRRPESALVEVAVDLDESIPLIQAPIGQVAEVFRNLIDNAYRAVREGGRLTVASRLTGGKICVRVQDTGPGIPLSIRERLFIKPVLSKEAGGPAGLGLWLSLIMLQRIGGDIAVERTGSSGTTMLVRIPIAPVRDGQGSGI